MVDFVTGCGVVNAARLPRRGAARLRLLLRAARGRLRLRADRGHRHAGSRSRPGPAPSGATADLLPGRRRRRSTWAPASRPLVRADRLAAELGLGELWIKNDTANPTGSFKDRVVSVALTKARQLGLQGGRLRLDRQPGQLGGRPRGPGRMDSVVLIPPDLEAAKVTMTTVYGGTRDRRRRHLRRRQPALRRADQRAPDAGPSSTSTCAPTTPRAPRPWPSRSPSSSAGRLPTTSSSRSARAAS